MSQQGIIKKGKAVQNNKLDKQFKDGKRQHFINSLNKKFNQTTTNAQFKQISKLISDQVVNSHIELVKKTDGEILAVSSDPKTFEMRRDLQPEIKRFRMRYLKRDFVE